MGGYLWLPIGKSFLMENYDGKYDFILAYTTTVPTVLLANPKLEVTYQVLDAEDMKGHVEYL